MAADKIFVCDDSGSRAQGWADDIRSVPGVASAYEVDFVPTDKFAKAFEALRKRKTFTRKADTEGKTFPEDDASFLDEAAMVIVDYDLTSNEPNYEHDYQYELAGSFGDQFAYLVRCFSKAAYTVVVNQDFPSSTFDLTFRRFDYSYGDLNIAASDLTRESLWTGVPDGTFRPWHWPRLLDAPERMRRLTAAMRLDGKVLEVLGLADKDVAGQFFSEQLEVLGAHELSGTDVTFKDLATGSRFGLLQGDRVSEPALLSKIATTATLHWLERFVVPAQNVLVDAPHLAQRRPDLLTAAILAKPETLCDLSASETVRASFDGDAVDRARVAADGWTSRPVWAWPRVAETTGRTDRDLGVFCEDISQFKPFDEAIDFLSSVPGPYRQRFVVQLDAEGIGIDYVPIIRLL